MGEPAYLSYVEELTVEHCAGCGMAFGLPTSVQRRRRDDHASFYCPAGHSQNYPGPSEAEKLKATLARTEATLNSERQLRSQVEKKLRKVEKRIRNGVCTHCNRTFENLARHMVMKHSAPKESHANT